LVVFTAEDASEDEIKGLLGNTASATDADLRSSKLSIVKTGVIEAFSHRFKARPAPCGVSVGHVNITAGTIGSLSRGRTAPRNKRLMLLSNNHVLADVNAGPVGAIILQPGPIDGGVNPRDQIGVLERFVPVNFGAGAVNFVDCATAWVKPNLVRKEFVRLISGRPRYFRVSGASLPPTLGRLVSKSGRSTQFTTGRISTIGATVNVNFGAGRVATFQDQFSVVSASAGANFSQGGDSGSLLWTPTPKRRPVGLLFAGGYGITFANRIDHVLSALDISLVT
jgi:hypothetical protein